MLEQIGLVCEATNRKKVSLGPSVVVGKEGSIVDPFPVCLH